MKKIIIISVTLIAGLLWTRPAIARENATDWYIEKFHTEIQVNQDSSLTISERILADCGQCYNKHGIFRVVPTQIKTSDLGVIRTPIKLISITDATGNSYQYETIKSGGTVTWKIGDPNTTVTGKHEYDIVYKVENAIRGQSNFDELYWNLNGNYWELETDFFDAKIIFPSGIDRSNVDVTYFTGALGNHNNDLSVYDWLDSQTLHFQSTRTLLPGEGITVSLAMPKGIISSYVPPFSEKYRLDVYGWYIIPILVFLICFYIWKKYGDDPNLHRVTMAEYDPPDNLQALYIGMIWKGGTFKNNFITAAIIQMACQGLIKITQTEKKLLFIGTKDYEFALVQNTPAPTTAENQILGTLFSSGTTTRLSDHPRLFASTRATIKRDSQEYLADSGYMDRGSYKLRAWFWGLGIFCAIFSFIFINNFSSSAVFPLILSGVIFFIFSFFMTKLTSKGAETQWRTKGFHLYMDMAEKYRDRFYEKENIFEKLLPYAIAFGMTKQWIKKMREIYGDERFAAMTPIWFHSPSGDVFEGDSFSNALSAMSASIGRSVSTSSGRGGGGFSGGGGGGGGGGGW